MTPADDNAVGVAPDVPLSEIALEPETVQVLDEVDPYVTTLPFHMRLLDQLIMKH